MCSLIQFAHHAGPPGTFVFFAVFVLTIAALAFIVRQPRKTDREQEEK